LTARERLPAAYPNREYVAAGGLMSYGTDLADMVGCPDRRIGRLCITCCSHSQKLRMLLTHRKLLQSKAIAIENDLRATLRNFGLKVGIVGTVKFEARIKELVENLPDLAVLV
jgi:hypothetical protein